MRRICIILALWLHAANTQYGGNVTKSCSGEGGDREYNKNTRDSFGYTDLHTQDHLLSHKKETGIFKSQEHQNTDTEMRLPTKSSTFDADSTTREPSTARKIQPSDSFNAKLFDLLSSKAQEKNLVFSPISLQTLLAFIFTMSGGKLHKELAQLLAISGSSAYVAKVFENILQKSVINTQTTTLIMANKLYYDYRLGPVEHSVQSIAKQSFASEIEQINFYQPENSANIINSWVSEKTRHLIKDIVTPSSISGEMSALLLNSIYFKSEWETKFASSDTEKQDFFTTKQEKVRVDMMYNEDVFRYGDFSEELQATVLELPYKNSNFSMLLILPKDIDSLTDVERKLRYYDFGSISQNMKREIVTVKLPRFKIEYEIDLIAPLQEMGLSALFNDAGSIHLFKNQQNPLTIDQFKHKSFINVNEAGTEAAATTVAKYVPLSIQTNMKYFFADHPFVFVIRHTNITVFMGHVVKF